MAPTAAQVELREKCDKALLAVADLHRHPTAIQAEVDLAYTALFKACQLYCLAGGNIYWRLWDARPAFGQGVVLNAETTAVIAGFMAFPADLTCIKEGFWGCLLVKRRDSNKPFPLQPTTGGEDILDNYGPSQSATAYLLTLKLYDAGQIDPADINGAIVCKNNVGHITVGLMDVEVPQQPFQGKIHTGN